MKTLLAIAISAILLTACGGSDSGAPASPDVPATGNADTPFTPSEDGGTASPDDAGELGTGTPSVPSRAADDGNLPETEDVAVLPGSTPGGPSRPPATGARPVANACDFVPANEPFERLIEALGTLPLACSAVLGEALTARIDDGRAGASDVVGGLLDAIENGAEAALPLEMQLLGGPLRSYLGQVDEESGRRIVETLIGAIVDRPGAGSGYRHTAIGLLADDFPDRCASLSTTPDCLDAAAAAFAQPDVRYATLAAVDLYRSVLRAKTSFGDSQARHLADLLAHDDPLVSAEGAKLAADVFDRTLATGGAAEQPPAFTASDAQKRLLTDALAAAFDDAVTPPEAAVRTAHVAHALHSAYVLVSQREGYASYFEGLAVPAETIERRVRLKLEETYLMPEESCTYTAASGRAVSVRLHLPANADARSVDEIRDCETYRASTDLFLDTLGEAFGSRSSDVPDVDPSVFYFEDRTIHEPYSELYLQTGNVGGLFQRYWSVTDEDRYNALYISGGVASRHVAAHEFTHYLFGRHAMPNYVDYGRVMQMINEGLAEYVAYHAFAGPEPGDSIVSRICDYPPPYPTLASILDGNSFGLDYDLAYVYVLFLIEREPATFQALLSAFRAGDGVAFTGAELIVGDERFDVGALDASLHALFDGESFCGGN